MKKYLAVVFLFVSVAVSAQSWLWAKQGFNSKNGDGEGWHTAIDLAGNTYLAGFFYDTITIGSYTLKAPLNSDNSCLIKFDNNGNVLWAKQSQVPSPVSYAFTYSTITDRNNNIYISGDFQDTINFNGVILDKRTTHRHNIFTVKYNSNGNVIWGRQSLGSGSYNDITYSNCTDKLGNIYTIGRFDDTIIFNKDTLTSFNFSVFIVKYDSNGNEIWAKQSHGDYYSNSFYSATDTNGNLYITGDVNGTMVFGKDTVKSLSLNTENFYLTKMDWNGNFIWSVQGKGTINSWSSSEAVTTDKRGNIYVTGIFSDTNILSNDTLIYPVIKDPSNYDAVQGVFFAKYNTNGNLIWAKQSLRADSIGWSGYSICLDTLNNIFISGGGTGQFGTNNQSYVAIKFDSIQLDAYDSIQMMDPAFIFKFDSSGNALCGVILKSGGDDNNSISVNPDGTRVTLGGDLFLTQNFGTDTLKNQRHEFIFMSQWQPCMSYQGINEIGSNESPAIVYPNPSTGIYYIQQSEQGKSEMIEVYNMLGEEIMKETLRQAQGDNTIDLSVQPAGLYLYRITDEQGQLLGSGKLIKE